MATPALRESLVQNYVSQAAEASLHSGDPGSTGANEIAGVTRQPLTWDTGAVDGEAITAQLSFDVPAATDVAFVGIWSSGGTFIDAVPSLVSFGTAGTYTLTLHYRQT